MYACTVGGVTATFMAMERAEETIHYDAEVNIWFKWIARLYLRFLLTLARKKAIPDRTKQRFNSSLSTNQHPTSTPLESTPFASLGQSPGPFKLPFQEHDVAEYSPVDKCIQTALALASKLHVRLRLDECLG